MRRTHKIINPRVAKWTGEEETRGQGERETRRN
jgi:hypothetical protein